MQKWDFKADEKKYPISQFTQSRNYQFEENDLSLPDESLIKDLPKAVDRIIQAIQKNEKIVIFGDDDLDGISSTYLLFDYLRKIGCQNHFYYIRNRNTDVHGLSQKFIKRVSERKYDLVITVDCCVSCYNEVEELNKLSVDTIITDHHLIPDKLPPAFAILNSKQTDCNYPDKMLAGVGVVFMLIRALSKKIEVPYSQNYLLWAAIGTIIDKAPLKHVNKVLVKSALAKWNDFKDDNLFSIIRGRKIYVDSEKMKLINYIGRVLSAGKIPDGKNKAFEFLNAPLNEKGTILLELTNEKKEYDGQLRFVSQFLDNLRLNDVQESIIYYDEEKMIPTNFMGFAASLLTSKYKVPVLILQQKEDILVCEARCTKGFDLVAGFEYSSEFILQFGGHVKAAGCSLLKDNFKNFKEKYLEYIKFNKQEIIYNRKIEIDILLDSFDNNLYDELQKFSPFGEGNPEPIIMCKNFDSSFYPFLNINQYCGIDLSKTNDIVFKFIDKNRIKIIDFREGKNEN
ncbi:MAG: DHH family phosphoesterase [Candidatus Cloacimonadota bacterium]|nr:DHH family phosphoesterase [Candidatus Cloacimonadota bacterium]